MKKLTLSSALLITFMAFISVASAMINPWTDCGSDMNCGETKAGFSFPLKVENYTVRAMKGMFEVRFPLDDERNVIIRKTEIAEGNADENGIIDISGDYNNYPVNKTVTLANGVNFSVRGDENHYYVANFAAETGYYGIICDKGLSLDDLEHLYELLEAAEAPHNQETL